MKLLYRTITGVLLVLLCSAVSAQEVLRIEGVRKVSKGENLKVKPGTTIVFSPGARIWVEGSLEITGTEEQPVFINSQDTKDPGIGIFVNGVNQDATVHIAHARFSNISRPLSFEPFWARREVTLDNLRISSANFDEAVLFVAAPLVNQNLNPIRFSLTNSEFFNNQSGVIMENAGASGYHIALANLVFDENHLSGSDISLGILHLNIASPFAEKNLEIGNLAFHNNTSGDKTIGISLGGNAENINGAGIFAPGSAKPVYDYYSDPRLPVFKAPLNQLNTWSGKHCFIENLTHLKGLVLLKSARSCSVVSLLDSNENAMAFTQQYLNDSLRVTYTTGIASMLITAEGMRIALPFPIMPADTSKPAILKPEEQPKKEKEQDTTLVKPFVFKPSFEIGGWGGLAFYIGDVRHRFGIPGCFEWTGGFFLQYNRSENYSLRATYYRTNIGMMDPTAPLYIFRGSPHYETINGVATLMPHWYDNFKTKMYILSFDAIYYLGKNRHRSAEGNKGFFVPGVGLGIAFMRFDPYRNVVYSKDKDTAEFIPLRALGMEGQNFLSNKKKYGAYTMNFNVAFELGYVYKRFKFRYEVKAVFSMSDYLDDFGQGYTYGGDYQKWKDNIKEVDLPVNKYTGKQLTWEQVFQPYNTSSKRTYNLLPDMFVQQHIGVSYNIGNLPLRLLKHR